MEKEKCVWQQLPEEYGIAPEACKKCDGTNRCKDFEPIGKTQLWRDFIAAETKVMEVPTREDECCLYKLKESGSLCRKCRGQNMQCLAYMTQKDLNKLEEESRMNFGKCD